VRILHLDTGQELRGGQRQVQLLLKTLRAASYECRLFARPGGALWHHARAGGGHPLPATLLSVWRRSADYDLVHAHDARAHTIAALASRVPFVVSRRVAFPVSPSMASRWKYGRAARYLAVSEFVAEQLRAAGVPAGKIDVVYDAIEVPSASGNWSPDRPVVALASTDPLKGRDLVERASELAGVPVVFSADLAKDLKNASVFVYISRSEGFGSAALLAMSMGVPVIASKVGGLMEVVEDGVSGLGVNNDPAQIAEALKRLMQQPEATHLLIENARRRVGERFSTELLLDRTVASYRRALAR
jgi:glycosyltransferase involved in cell wall biosynthesis